MERPRLEPPLCPCCGQPRWMRLSEMVSRYVEIEGDAPEYRAKCPFCAALGSTLRISDKDMIFRCSSCEAGGDVFSWVMRIEGVEFKPAFDLIVEAMQKLWDEI